MKLSVEIPVFNEVRTVADRTGRVRPVWTGLMLLLAGSACSRPAPTDPRMVSEWTHALYGLVRAERLSPPVASRLFAYASVALYEGMAAASTTLPSLAGTLNGLDSLPRASDPGRLDQTLVAVTAERTLLDSLFRQALPTTQAAVARLADSLAASRDLDAGRRARSTALGREIGLALVAWSRSDGFAETRGLAYRPPAGPGLWINDSPPNVFGTQSLSSASQAVSADDPSVALRPGTASDRALVMSRPKARDRLELPAVNMAGATEPYWGRLRPFLLTAWNECPVPEPPPYSTSTESAMYREAMELVALKAGQTPEQRAIALYWADNPGETATPAGHWVAIATQLTSQRSLSAEQATRVLLAASLAQADAFLAAWGYKYQFNQIRPRTYIRRVIDPAWEPQLSTPPFPEYPAGHSTQSASASVALQAQLGDMAFDDSTGLAVGHPVRRFASFDQAAAEAGYSRLLGGIHFQSGNAGGRALGKCIGTRTVERLRAAGAL